MLRKMNSKNPSRVVRPTSPNYTFKISKENLKNLCGLRLHSEPGKIPGTHNRVVGVGVDLTPENHPRPKNFSLSPDGAGRSPE